MTIEQLKTIAALIHALRGDAPYWSPSVSLGIDDAALAAIAALGGQRRTSVYEPGKLPSDGWRAIESAAIDVDDVRFQAQGYDRAATAEEIAAEQCSPSEAA